MTVSERTTVAAIRQRKNTDKIVVLTAYDYSFASMLDAAGVDIVLVGDSMGMVVYGHATTREMTVDDMVRHTQAVRRGVQRALVVTDMPSGSYETEADAVMNAQRLIAAGADAVKLEGETEIAPVIRALRSAGIEVMGHVGLMPQTAAAYKVQGKTRADARRIYDAARVLAGADVFSMVLECIPCQLAERITHDVPVPTIGIGAGAQVDGQVLVSYDLFGVYPALKPKFVRSFGDPRGVLQQTVRAYAQAVRAGDYPSVQESFTMDAADVPTE